MIERNAARQIADRDASDGVVIDDEGVRELRSGWFFPYRYVEPVIGGFHGVIVNKKTAKTFRVGGYFDIPVERDLDLYDRGYQYENYDLVITNVADIDKTLEVLEKLEISVVEPTYEYGAVWRVPRRLTQSELRERIKRLPQVFGDLRLYHHSEILERARAEGAFGFEALECRLNEAFGPTRG